jgi:hypothetical protein
MRYFLIQSDLVFFDRIDCIENDKNYVIIRFCSGYSSQYKYKDNESAVKCIESIATQMALS